MAHFLIQPKGESGEWCFPKYAKLNLTVNADKERLEKLRADNENVYKISFNDAKDKRHGIIEGKLVSVYEGSALKVEVLVLAVEERWTYEEAMRVLYKFSPSQRRKLLKEAASGD